MRPTADVDRMSEAERAARGAAWVAFRWVALLALAFAAAIAIAR